MSQVFIIILAITFCALSVFIFYFRKSYLSYFGIIIAFIIANILYFSQDATKGWPIKTDNISGIALSVIIDSPDERSDGAIYVILMSEDELKWYEYGNKNDPRIYSIQYTTDRAIEFQKVSKAIQEGYKVRINNLSVEGLPESSGGEGSTLDNIGEFIKNLTDKLMGRNQNLDTYTPKMPSIEYIPPEDLMKKE